MAIITGALMAWSAYGAITSTISGFENLEKKGAIVELSHTITQSGACLRKAHYCPTCVAIGFFSRTIIQLECPLELSHLHRRQENSRRPQ